MGDAVVRIVDTGIANTASVRAAFSRCGCASEVTGDRSAIEDAAMLVLPGVGAFGAGMERLRELGVAEVIRDRVGAGRPTMAICLGFQLLFERSEESEGIDGIGAIPGRVARFGGDVRVPQLGWNRVEGAPEGEIVRNGFAYFANSYRVAEAPQGWACAMSDHSGRFVAAIERGAVVGCQFHPEVSGAWGAGVVRRWVARAREGVAAW